MRSSKPTVILVLLVLAVTINYIDRGSLSVAKPEVAKDFNLDPVQMGWLFSAFFWSYSVCHLAAGWLVDRYDVKWVYAIGFFIWSLATVAMGVFSGFAIFFALRLLLGIGESVAFPATSRIIVANFPERRRGLANSLVDAGSKIGPALSMLLGGLVVAEHGWRALFLIVGLGSLLWLIPWLTMVPSQKPLSPSDAGHRQATPITELIKRREVWGTSLGFFCLGYVWYFLVSWLPSYLEEERGFSKEDMSIFGSLPFWAMAATSLTGGWLSDRWIAAGGTPTLVRRTFLIGGLLLCAGFMYPVTVVQDSTTCVVLLVAACASLGFYTSNAWAVTQTLAGPTAAGQWTGVQNFVGNLGGVVSPALTGWLVKETGSFNQPFIAATVVLVVGVTIYLTLVPRVEPLNWEQKQIDG
jgi:MFS family permease